MTPVASPHPWRWRAPLFVALVLVVAAAGAFLALNGVRLTPQPPSRTAGPAGGAGATSGGSASAAQGSPEASSAQASTCIEGALPGGGNIGVCIAGPTPRSAVSGTVSFEAKVTGAGGAASGASGSGGAGGGSTGIQRAGYMIDGRPLLTAFQPPYRFSLDTKLWPDGAHRISVTLTTRDGLTTAPAAMDLTFNNGASSTSTVPGDAAPFHPTSGTPASGAPFVVAAVGDGASGEKGETETVDRIGSWKPNLFLYLGDVYENGRLEEFDNWYGTATSQGMYGVFRPITDPTVGNHEYQGSDAPGYFGYWQGIGHYYSFDAGGWHFISLDANLQFAQFQPGTAQYDWLANDLSSSNAACTVAYWHQPLFNAGTEPSADNMQQIWQLLAQHHVTMVLNGHDHDYQRWQPLDGTGSPSDAGITEFIVGSGGHGHQNEHHPDQRLAASDWKDFGALKLTLSATAAQFAFVTSGGSVADSGTVKCQGGAGGAAAGLPIATAEGSATSNGLPDAALVAEPLAVRRGSRTAVGRTAAGRTAASRDTTRRTPAGATRPRRLT